MTRVGEIVFPARFASLTSVLKHEKLCKAKEGEALLRRKMPYLIQENTCQDLVAEPYPFIYHRKKEQD